MTIDNGSRNTPDRMDLPFVGLPTFARQPACADWDRRDGADVAVLAIPIDTASSYRVVSRPGLRDPRGFAVSRLRTGGRVSISRTRPLPIAAVRPAHHIRMRVAQWEKL
jgi:hypothetical protein